MNGKTPTELREAVEKFSQCTVVPFRDINETYQIDKDIDAVVISGSKARIVIPSEKALFENVSRLIKNCNLPILGICYGHQLLCSAFDAKMKSLGHEVHCFEKVEVIETDGIFNGFKAGQSIPLSEHHNDYVSKESLETAGFTLLAKSNSCEVEAVKHGTKPFYGVQFHPERINIKGVSHAEGHKVIENFFRIVNR